MSEQPFDVVVVGAGAAGLMAAGFAASSGARPLLLEKSADGGKKILISGGGRCNVLPSRLSTKEYLSTSPHARVKKILRSWSLADQRSFFEEQLGIKLVLEEETGKLFPASNRARDVRDRLVNWVREMGATLRFGVDLSRVDQRSDAIWVLGDAEGNEYLGRRVILATGGLSVPKTGSDGFGLKVARGRGHVIEPTYPALTPLLTDEKRHHDLAGLSLSVQISGRAGQEKRKSDGGFLFTHRGYSGPSVLDISDLHVRAEIEGRGAELHVRWTELGEEEWRRRFLDGGRRGVGQVLREELPGRLTLLLLEEAGIAGDLPCSELPRDRREKLLQLLLRYRLEVSGDEGYKKAEVTGGGVSLDEIDRRTMESKRMPGLFLCGEMLDCFGPIGGYNFLWAWVTGRLAGLGAAADEPSP